MENHHQARGRIGNYLASNFWAKLGEILILFLFAFAWIQLWQPLAGDHLVWNQAVIWTAYILMLALVYLGLYLRGETWSAFGLSFGRLTYRQALRMFLLSLLVFVLAVAGFVFGSIVMANITGIPEKADMSGYEYLQDNLFMLILALLGVYIVSSFGEEVIYRGFLINRLTELGLDTRWGQALVVLISAIVFGLVHYGWGPMGMVQTGFMGLVLGICYLKLKKRLWILILAHAYMDTILLLQMYFA